MRRSRYLPYLLTVAGVLLLMGALHLPSHMRTWQPPPPVEPAACLGVSEQLKRNPHLTALVDQAIQGLSEPKRKWLECNVWLKMHVPDFTFEATGSYLRGPGQRFRMELRTWLPDPAGGRGTVAGATVLALSDGQDLWTAQRIGAKWEEVKHLKLSSILNGPDSPVSLPHVRNVFLSSHALRGLERCLRCVNGHFDWVKREDNQGDIQLIGRWQDWMLKMLVKPNQPWTPLMPRFCRMTLHGPELWPARIEWWGPLEENGPNQLLVEMEYRDPVFDHSVPEERWAALFSFSPGETRNVEDLTPRVRSEMIALTQEVMKSRH
jgi:hypothetical protein